MEKRELICIGCPMGCPLTVTLDGGILPAVSCKTRSDIPKEKIFDVVRALKSVVVPAPVQIGQVLLPDAAGTGVDVVATKDVAEV